MRRFVGVFWLLVLFGFVFINTRAQDSELSTYNNRGVDLCPYKQGTYYSLGLVPRYETRNNRIVLISWITGEVVAEIESSLNAEMRFEPISWSPDCRYLAAHLQPYGHFRDGEIIFWDTVVGTRAHTFDHPYKKNSRDAWFYPRTAWKPDSQWVIVRTTNGYFAWQPGTDYSVLLVHPSVPYYDNPDLKHVYWDGQRNLVIMSGWPVRAYDLTTGLERIVFKGDNFFVSPDQSKVITFNEGTSYDLAVWDLDTAKSVSIPPTGIIANGSQVTISDDNRYLIAGREAIRVWDLQNLPEAVEDRLPLYRHGGPKGLIWSVRFVEPTVIETTSDDGVQKWDLHTGAYIP
ncbi:MAG TPA: WD40 repeat domain-containing protein [Phototrophicaceae bacterium]|nr:WD40 repeat domain-containing protein [Phototrophicaceae bacterium]